MTYALAHYRERLIPFLLSFLLSLFMTSPTQAAPWILKKADTPEPVTEEQITELEGKAKNGDWQLKMEFAAAYLYDTHYPLIYGCNRLKYGGRCRAMAKRVESASIFLQEIVDTIPKNEGERIDIGSFQEDYALSLRPPLFILERDSTVCRDKVHYYELAVKNGSWCVALNLESMAKNGVCMEKNYDRAEAYRRLIPPQFGCPTP